MDWYESLDRPQWTPPSSWFGPVWTVLYVAMTAAALIVLVKAGPGRALAVFLAQLALNLAWPVVFFRWHRLWLSVAVILLLIPAVVWCTLLFWRVSRIAGALLLPYLVWVGFAATLNVAIAAQN